MTAPNKKDALTEVLGGLLYDAWEEGVTTEEQSDTVAEWLAQRLLPLINEAQAESIEECADERGSLWSTPHSVCFDCAEQVGTWLHDRAAVARWMEGAS